MNNFIGILIITISFIELILILFRILFIDENVDIKDFEILCLCLSVLFLQLFINFRYPLLVEKVECEGADIKENAECYRILGELE